MAKCLDLEAELPHNNTPPCSLITNTGLDIFFSPLIDINDCLTNNGGCQQQCFNKPGRGVICKCSRGYTSSGRKCHGKNCLINDQFVFYPFAY